MAEENTSQKLGHVPEPELPPVDPKREDGVLRRPMSSVKRDIRLIIVGIICAIFALACDIAGILTTTTIPSDEPMLWLTVIAVFCILAMALWQLRGWVQAKASWDNQQPANSALWGISWGIHMVSYLVLLIGLLSNAMVASAEPTGSVSFWCFLVGALLLIAAQALGPTQYVRSEGPPGTLLANFRGLAAGIKQID